MREKKELFDLLNKNYEAFFIDSFNIRQVMSFCLVFTGALLGFGLKAFPSLYVLPSLALAFIFGFISFLLGRLLYQREEKFPIKLLNHLTALEDLDVVTKRYDRKEIIDTYIDQTIEKLNKNTCDLTSSDGFPYSEICVQGLQGGLEELLENLISNPNHFLNVNKSKFTLGIISNNIFNRISDYYPNCDLEFRSVAVNLRDDLFLQKYIPGSFEDGIDSRGEKWSITTCFLDSYKNNRYYKNKIKLNEIDHTIVTAPIPSVCEDGAIGIFYVIFEGESELPSDLEKTFTIFGRVTANWIEKYNNCTQNEFNSLQLQAYSILPLIDHLRRIESQTGLVPSVEWKETKIGETLIPIGVTKQSTNFNGNS